MPPCLSKEQQRSLWLSYHQVPQMLRLLDKASLLTGRYLSIDASDMEANAGMESIV